MKKAYISEIQHFCVHDGPGLRTTVFFQGCPIRCLWCQNPETISCKPILMYNGALCKGCGACLAKCPQNTISYDENSRIKIDTAICDLCGECVNQCYFMALTFSSQEMTVDEVYDEVIKEKVAYQKSGGGVTLSGGEPLLQKAFCQELLYRIKEQNVSTAVETAGFVHESALLEIQDKVDTFLFDLKMSNDIKHEYWTGVSNKVIKQNIKMLTDIHDNVVIRIPLIPGVNDTSEEFGDMMQFVSGLRHINSVHILPFHNAGAGKYEMIGTAYTLWDLEENNEERVEACKKIAEGYGVRVNVGGTGFLDDKKVN